MLARILRWQLDALYGLFLGWLIGLLELLGDVAARRQHRQRVREAGPRHVPCQVIPASVYKRPDPLIYCQSFLMSQGLAVTWDNPDIQLFAIGPSPGQRTPIDSSELQPDTVYEIRATIYNGSTEAPAIGMVVEFSYLSFGIGTVSHPIGSTKVDLNVKGSPLHPASTTISWRTPLTPGHYCIQVRLIWADDANPNNNLGQENTNVGVARSPAVFDFEVYNGNVAAERIDLRADMYTIPDPVDCDEQLRRRNAPDPRQLANATEDEQKDAQRAWCVSIARRHDIDAFPIAADWTVVIAPKQFELDPGATQTINVEVTPPPTFTGTQAININGFNEQNQLLGGVTLYTER